MKTIRWGMIGCGDVTEVKSGPGFYKADHSMLYGVTNRTISKAYDYAKRHSIEKVFKSAEELIADDNIDAVYIATPPSSHKGYALQCAAAKKVCYIEKPMALNYQECVEIMDAFHQTKTKAYVAYYRRQLDQFVTIKNMIESKQIGNVRFVEFSLYRPALDDETEGNWHVNPDISGGGPFMDLAVHELDILDYILGEITEAKGIYQNQASLYQPEDIVSACFKFKNGVTGTGIWCFTAYKSVDMIKIVGDQGSVTFECYGQSPIILETKNSRTELPIQMPMHVHQNLIQSVVDELNGIGNCPSTIESAARTARICDMIYGRL